jgi:hypothetical protein
VPNVADRRRIKQCPQRLKRGDIRLRERLNRISVQAARLNIQIGSSNNRPDAPPSWLQRNTSPAAFSITS